MLLIYRFLAGAGLGGAMPSFISLASEYVPARARATIVGFLWAGFPLGGVIGGLLASWMIPALGWGSIFILGGVLPLTLAGVLVAILPESARYLVNSGASSARIARTLARVYPRIGIVEGTRFTAARHEMARASVRQLFAEGRATGTILLWISFFFAFMALVANSSWSPILLRGVGIPVQRSAVALAAYNFGSLFGSCAAGFLVTRLGAARVLSATLTAGALAYALIGWVAPAIPAITIAETFFGLFLGCAGAGLIALSAIVYPSAIRSTGVGWATGVGRIGSATGPLVIGLLAEAHWPARAIFTAVGSSVLIGAAACALMGLLRRRGEDGAARLAVDQAAWRQG